jgi:hypothetical protein
MTKTLVNIREIKCGLWVLTIDGRVLGDCKVYGSAKEVREAAIDDVARDPEYRQLADIVRRGWDADVEF